jgi:predicted Zn-dependent peptidase
VAAGVSFTKFQRRITQVTTENIRKMVLPNGVRVVLERIPYVRSASVGIWIDVGSRNETSAESGLSHFIEHMFFKGTRRLNAYQLGQEMNKIGGNVNAFTTQEHICISAKVVDEHLTDAMDLLFEMFHDSVFAPEEIERERNVILEEVKMYDDTPDELVVDVFMDRLYAENSLGQPILGKPENIQRFTRDEIGKFAGREFTPDRVVISIAGNFDLRRIEPRIRKQYEHLCSNGWEKNIVARPVPAFQSRNVDRKLEQVHFCMGTDGPTQTSDDRFAFAIMNTILGGGASSRIFQEVREKRGLAYSIGSFDIMFRDSGCFAVSGGCSPRNIARVIDLCLAEVKKAFLSDVTSEELLSAKEQLKSGILLGMESSSNRMGRLAECELYFGEYQPVDRVLERIASVSADDVRQVAESYLKNRPISFASIGPEKKFEPYLAGMSF